MCNNVIGICGSVYGSLEMDPVEIGKLVSCLGEFYLEQNLIYEAENRVL